MSNPLIQLALGALLLAPGPGPGVLPGSGAGGAERLWEMVHLPANFVLDLGTGIVTSRGEGQRPTLEYSRGRLHSASPLRLLPPHADAPRTRIDRDGGVAVSGTQPAPGQELVFDCFEEAWGYLRVLAISDQAIELEYLLEPDLRRRELVREPARVGARSGPSGVQLDWSAQAGLFYRIERRRLPRDPGDQRGDWEEVARVSSGRWTDDQVALARFSEYRVTLDSEDGGFGATGFGAAGIEPPDVRCEVGPGSELNLLSATTDNLRTDLTIEYVRSNGVQFFPGEGVEARVLMPEEESEWVLPELFPDGFRRQRFFVPPGRTLAVRLPEGVHGLVRVESVRGEIVTLGRQLDLDGGRVFPPVPDLPRAIWEPGRGVVFEFDAERKAPPEGAPMRLVEREETLDAGDWVVCARGAVGQQVLVDADVGDKLLVRYRFRQGLGGGQLSPSSAPLTVLVGGDSQEARAALLERAILDLGSADYDRRGRARAVLLALGEGAWPILRDALRSENAELASAARDLLKAGAGQDDEVSGNLARLLISIRAEELGLEHPPHPDWVSPQLGARASAALRGLGWRETTAGVVADWRRVLAEADPQESVRLCAGLAALLAEEGLGPDLGPLIPARTRKERTEDEWLADLDLEQPRATERVHPWSRLVEMQARHELDDERVHTSAELARARENGVLARFLTAHYDRTDDELFLDCALRLIADPVARLRGAVEFAETLRRPDRFGDAGRPAHVVRLEAPDSELLLEELNLLRDNDLRGIEFVLPAGVYDPLPDGQQIVIEKAAFRLRGEGTVELHLGITLQKGSEAVFENLRIVPESGIAVNVHQSSLLLRDCLLRGGSLGLLGTNAVVELERSAVIAPKSAGLSASAIRFSGLSMLLASESRIESAGVALYAARATLLDRCVVLSTQLVGIEGSSGGDLWIVNSLVKSRKAPFTRVTQGVLDGAILYGELEAALSNAAGLKICSEHLRCDGELAPFDRALWLGRCALGR
jgi:hypothetical protein